MSKNLKSKILDTIVAGTLLTGVLQGCYPNSEKELKKYHCETIKIVEKGDTWWKYAAELQDKYPEILGNLDTREVYPFLQKFNNHPSAILAEGEEIKIPECYY